MVDRKSSSDQSASFPIGSYLLERRHSAEVSVRCLSGGVPGSIKGPGAFQVQAQLEHDRYRQVSSAADSDILGCIPLLSQVQTAIYS